MLAVIESGNAERMKRAGREFSGVGGGMEDDWQDRDLDEGKASLLPNVCHPAITALVPRARLWRPRRRRDVCGSARRRHMGFGAVLQHGTGAESASSRGPSCCGWRRTRSRC